MPGPDPRAGEIAVVAHGGTLRVLTAYLRGVPVERMTWDPVGNGRILRLAARAGHPVTKPPERNNQMNHTTLQLPRRAAKPRPAGLTMVIDGGLPLWNFVDIVSSAAEYIDFVKFGWGTAVVTGDIDAKIDVLRENDIGFYFGGTLFEKYVLQDRFDDFRKFCASTAASTSRCRTGPLP